MSLGQHSSGVRFYSARIERGIVRRDATTDYQFQCSGSNQITKVWGRRRIAAANCTARRCIAFSKLHLVHNIPLLRCWKIWSCLDQSLPVLATQVLLNKPSRRFMQTSLDLQWNNVTRAQVRSKSFLWELHRTSDLRLVSGQQLNQRYCGIGF